MSIEGKEPEVIDGLSAEKRFFLAYATNWRQKGRDEIMIQRLATDPHSPAEFRCNQIVRNIDAFYEAFDVTPNDAMWLAEEHRVTIW
jgi:putative endopeptidase